MKKIILYIWKSTFYCKINNMNRAICGTYLKYSDWVQQNAIFHKFNSRRHTFVWNFSRTQSFFLESFAVYAACKFTAPCKCFITVISKNLAHTHKLNTGTWYISFYIFYFQTVDSFQDNFALRGVVPLSWNYFFMIYFVFCHM